MRAYSRPMVVTALGGEGQAATALERVPLSVKSPDALYDERWLQTLIHRHPVLLPVDQIEPALTPLVPICMELPTSCGPADNLLLTPDGGIVLVEAKLWRNGEARREVIGQVLDYAKDLSRWDYDKLQAAARMACKDPTLNLFQRVCGEAALLEDEAGFIDAVSRNLRLGRFLLIVAGDGIQENAEQLADFLQRHVGLHFTLAMVEISLWRTPLSGQLFVQPKILARTVQIERAVVRLEAGVALDISQIAPAAPNAKPTTISAETYYEALKAIEPTLPERLKAFLAEAEPLGIYPDIRRGMSLKWLGPDGREYRLGHIDLQGRFATDWAHGDANAIGRIDLSHAYQARLAADIPGAKVRETPTPIGWRIILNDQVLPVSALLNQKDAVLKDMASYIEALGQALAAPEQA